MNISFETNEKINTILEKINTLEEKVSNEKKWLSVSETAKYISYSEESIRKLIRSGEFVQGVHFHKKIKKLIFNRYELDKWIEGESPKTITNLNIDKTIEEIISSIRK